MDFSVIGVLGDLPARTLLFQMVTSFSKVYWPHHVCTSNWSILKWKNSVLRVTNDNIQFGKQLQHLSDQGLEDSNEYKQLQYVST